MLFSKSLFTTVKPGTVPQAQPEAFSGAVNKGSPLEKKERMFDQIREEHRRKIYPALSQEMQKRKSEEESWRQPVDHKPSGKFGSRWNKHVEIQETCHELLVYIIPYR